MKNMRIPHVLILTALLLLGPMAAQGQTRLNHQPQTFKAFWLKFKTAVAGNDKATVAAMTKLPFLFDNQDLDAAGFVRNYDKIINRRDKACFARAKPVKDGDSYSVFCGQVIFVFTSFDGTWKFSRFGPND